MGLLGTKPSTKRIKASERLQRLGWSLVSQSSPTPTLPILLFDWRSALGSGMNYAICLSHGGIRRREAKVSDVGGIDGLRPLPTLYTAINGYIGFGQDMYAPVFKKYSISY